MVEAVMTTDRKTIPTHSGSQDPFYNLDRILHGETIKAAPKVQSSFNYNLRPTLPAKNEMEWGDLEAEINNFTASQKKYSAEYQAQPNYHPTAFEEAPPRKQTSGLKTIGTIVGIALLGTTAVLGYRGLTGGSTHEPKIIKAQTTPEKTVIAPPVKDPATKSVLDKPASVAGVVPRDEKPLSSSQQAEQTTGIKTIQVDPDEPRKVRTVSITSDGGGNPVVKPTVQAVAIPASMPNMNVDTSNLPAKTVRTQTITASTKPVETTKPVEVKPQAVMPTKPVTPKQTASAPVQLTPSAPAPKVTAGGYAVQVGSAKTEEEARSTYKNLQNKHSALNGRSANFIAAEVNGNSLYRIRLSQSSKEAADSFCSSYKASGGACFVTKN